MCIRDREKAFKNPKMKWVWNSTLEEIVGDELVEKVIIKNIKTNELSEKEVNGVFFFVGTVPKTQFLQGKVELTEQGYIPTTELMETNVPGVYAVGDARVKYLRQVVTAAADEMCIRDRDIGTPWWSPIHRRSCASCTVHRRSAPAYSRTTPDPILDLQCLPAGVANLDLII